MANKKNDPNHLGFGRLMAWKSSDIAMAGLNVIVLSQCLCVSLCLQLLTIRHTVILRCTRIHTGQWNQMKRLNYPNLIPIFLGIMLG